MRRRRRLVLAAAGAAVALMATFLTAQTASADVPPPYFATSNNRSDPHMIKCTHPDTGADGFCLYTSKDMGQSYAYSGNPYPMEDTRVMWSPNGYDSWVNVGSAFHENKLEQAGQVETNSYHQWAPSAIKLGSYYYLYVPNITDKQDPSGSSKIFVARSTSPFGPFDYYGKVTQLGPGEPGYMSDPDLFRVSNSEVYLFWADGDGSTCGGFRSARLANNGSTSQPTYIGNDSVVTINGIGVLGNCGGTGRPYVEGLSIYKFNEGSMPGPYTIVFAAKPTSVPTECATGVGGSGTANEVIAYATSSSVQGPYTYKGIIICGSTTEWTNQATVMKVTTPSGKKPWVIVYHDSPLNIKERKLHAECLFAGNGKIAGVHRQPLNAANGFDDCIDNVNFNYSGLSVRSPSASHPPILWASASTQEVRMNRFAVGPWERFDEVTLSNGNVAYKSLATGRYLCAHDTSTPIKAHCTTSGMQQAQFRKVNAGDGEFMLESAFTGAYLGVCATDHLCASYAEQGTAWAARFTEKHLR